MVGYPQNMSRVMVMINLGVLPGYLALKFYFWRVWRVFFIGVCLFVSLYVLIIDYLKELIDRFSLNFVG